MFLHRTNGSQSSLLLVVVLFCFVSRGLATAEEVSLQRARQLRDQGQVDSALKMLRKLSDDMSLDEELRAVANYEIGTTLVVRARMVSDPMKRQQLLDEAQLLVKRFVAEYAEHPLAPAAGSQLGAILLERAKLAEARSNANLASPEEKKQTINTARKFYDLALVQFELSLKVTREKLKRIRNPLDPKVDREQIELRDQLRANYLQARILIPAIKEELADTYEEKSPRRHELLRSAVDEFGSCHEDFRTRVAGLYALMYKGRCYVKLGEYDRALQCFDVLFEQPDSITEFRELKLKSALNAKAAWLSDGRKGHAQAIDVMQGLVNTSEEDELRQPDWLQLRVNLARAYKLKADELSKAKDRSPETGKERKQSLAEALKHARWAAKIPGDHAEEARKLIAALPDTAKSDREAVDLDIKTFDEAQSVGKQLLSEVWKARARGDKGSQEKLLREAIHRFEQSLDLVETDTRIEDINVTRYCLSFAYFETENFDKAAELGEFLARRFSSSSYARKAAKIAMASYMKQLMLGDNTKKKHAASRTTSLCRHIVKTWPKDPLTTEASRTLITLALRSKNTDDAIANLALIPEGSRLRPELELQIGQTIWGNCLIELGRGGGDDPVSPRNEKFVERRKQAKRFLEQGIERMRSASKEPAEVRPFASGALALCQIYVEEQAFEKALTLLEDKTIGPYALVMANHPEVESGVFDIAAVTLATRVYRGIVESDKTDPATRKEAERKLKDAIVELDKRRKALEKGDGLDIDVTPIK